MTTASPQLRADCSRCFALCCVALPFRRSADFAFAKAGGEPCRHLRADFGCGIHHRLRDAGFAGCTAFDCFGAGQRIAQQTFGGQDWRDFPELAPAMMQTFPVMRTLHELLWYLTEALGWTAAEPVAADLRRARTAVERAADGSPTELAGLDVTALRGDIAPLLRRASALVRGTDAPDSAGADLAGRDLRRTDLRRTELRGALLIAADLRGRDLDRADLLGADLRDADLRGADLGGALFLTQAQVSAARGDAATRIPAGLDRPAHWSG